MSESLDARYNVARLDVLDRLRLGLPQLSMPCSVSLSPRQICAFCSSQMSFFCPRVRDTFPMADGSVAVLQQTVLHSKKAVMSDAVVTSTNRDCRNAISIFGLGCTVAFLFEMVPFKHLSLFSVRLQFSNMKKLAKTVLF